LKAWKRGAKDNPHGTFRAKGIFMPRKKANEAQFFFFCGSLKDETFSVMDFSGVDTISKPYHFSVTLLAHSADISSDQVVNKKASLHIFRDGEYAGYSGIVAEFDFLDRNVDFVTYRMKLVPQLWLLNLNSQTRVFQKKSVVDIIKEVLTDAGLPSSYAKFDVNAGAYPQQEFVVQYQESDLNFISRLMEGNGILYYFREPSLLPEEIDGGSTEEMVISDKASSFGFIEGESEVIFRSTSGLQEQKKDEDREFISRIRYTEQVIPKEVVLKNYNYRTPEVSLSGTKPIKEGDFGKVYAYGGQFKDADQAQKLAEIEANRIRTQNITVGGTGNCRGFRAGHRFTLKDHTRTSLNTGYLLTEVVHTGYQTGDQRGTYTNRFRCLPAGQADLYRPPRSAIIPRISGIMTAAIEADGSSYAALDDMGRYKVRMPFDLSKTRNYDGSKYMRLAQPYSGPNYGIHFPSHEGAEMVYACIDGDPDKPLGIGTVPNANTLSPVKSANKEQNVIRTAAGNEIVLDDTDGKQKMRLTTTAKNKVEMDDENKKIVVQSTDDNKLIIDDKNKAVTLNSASHSVKISYADGEEGMVISTAGGHVIKIDDANKVIQIQSSGGNKVELDDNDNKITLEDGAGKNTVTLDGGGGLDMQSKGEIKISAMADLTIDANNIKINAKSAFEAKANMDCKLSGMNFEAKGNMNAKVEGGMNIEVKGGMAGKFSGGVNAELSGGAMTKIAGGIVMIN
jgi:type VI secretion system secreted protein VgrG